MELPILMVSLSSSNYYHTTPTVTLLIETTDHMAGVWELTGNDIGLIVYTDNEPSRIFLEKKSGILGGKLIVSRVILNRQDLRRG